MTTLTYCKGLPTPRDELTPLGLTNFELFLFDYAGLSYRATLATVNYLLSLKSKFDKSKWNSYLQEKFGINKRQAGGIIALSQGKVDAARQCRTNHIKQLESKLKSAIDWVKKTQKKLRLARKFYAKKNWHDSKTGCNFPLATSLKTQKTNWYYTKFNLHHKKRYIYKLTQEIAAFKLEPIQVKVSIGEVFVVGSKDESLGNQTCQWDGHQVKFRVPYC
ncbi:hypothetical protein [Microcoleus sp. F4-D5]|uniref:hypothetical protein n=1 Tax=Microcoleus sp. F4-D5 TaxID=2818760 RepID=UPI002FD240BC